MKQLFFEETFSEEKGFLDVNVEAGSVQIRPHDGRSVTVEAEIENCIVTVRRDGNVVYVDSQVDKNLGSWVDRLRNGNHKTKSTLIIKVPHNCEIRSKTITGKLDVREIDAPITIHIITGKAKLADMGGSVYAKLVTGGLDYEGVLADASHRFEATTGNVRLRLSKEPNAQLKASTTTGKIKCEFPLNNGSQNRSFIGGQIRGTLGTGAGKIKAVVTTGKLSLERV